VIDRAHQGSRFIPQAFSVREQSRVICIAQRADRSPTLERPTEDFGLGFHVKAADQHRYVWLIVDGEISGSLQVTPDPVRPIAEASRVHGFRCDDQFSSKSIPTIGLARESPETFSDADLMQQRVPLIEVESHSVIEVTPVVIASPEVEAMQSLIRSSNAIDHPLLVEKVVGK